MALHVRTDDPPAEEKKPTRRRASEEPPKAEESKTDGAKADSGKPAGGDGAKSEQPASALLPSDTINPPAGETDPLGFAGASPFGPRRSGALDAVPIPDRWRIGWPTWDRYNRRAAGDSLLMNSVGGDSPFTPGDPLNPYDRNVLKGDYPIIGNEYFLNLSVISDSFFQTRKNPTPSGNSSQNPGSFDTFRDGRQSVFNQNLIVDVTFTKGYTSYRPPDYVIKVTPVFNLNYARVFENAVNISPTRGDERYDSFTALQEAFIDLHLGDTSEWFDVLTLKVGRQLFVSDFRGFVYSNVTDGIRLTMNAEANRIQANLAAFIEPEKDTNSGLNELNWRDQQILVANCFIQDFMGLLGYTVEGSFLWNHDRSNERVDGNGFVVRPDLIGSAEVRDLDVFYLGLTSDGHIGRVNVDSALYYAFGNDQLNPIAGSQQSISAFLGALELSVDFDWLRPKISFLYASGDGDPKDGVAEGFDSIIDDPVFAGGAGSFYQNQGLRIFGVGLNQGRSFLNSLRSSKIEGQSNFVNPGSMVCNAGLDAEVTPTFRTSLNANAIYFVDTSSLSFVLNQQGIHHEVGYEINLTEQWRPFLNNNVIISAGQSVFFPGEGFNDIYGDNKTLYQFFAAVTLTY